MRRFIKPAIYCFVAFFALAVLFLLTPPGIRAMNSFRYWRFTTNVKKNINPGEFQQWAITNLLSKYPDCPIDAYGTNLLGIPVGFSKMKRYGQRVLVAQEAVVLFVERGNPGHLVIGRPSFVETNNNYELWKPGIYFCKSSD
jgi:hypothetical protein